MNNEVKLPKDMMIVSETDEKGIIGLMQLHILQKQ